MVRSHHEQALYPKLSVDQSHFVSGQKVRVRCFVKPFLLASIFPDCKFAARLIVLDAEKCRRRHLVPEQVAACRKLSWEFRCAPDIKMKAHRTSCLPRLQQYLCRERAEQPYATLSCTKKKPAHSAALWCGSQHFNRSERAEGFKAAPVLHIEIM
ncbi:unnamed protein product [Symbiodinium sp. CCMP2592]|nr:unnamed protein product [Symbiodinium sp. CCMP2592]